ncbi:MAG: hypothetical protein LQ349_007268 [Xanthoria aureola]|nr:MAG: hypothetical protein LQ349_007268 [Xanthoria aureola]
MPAGSMPVRFNQYLSSTRYLLTSQVGTQYDAQIKAYQLNRQGSGNIVTRDLCRDALNCVLDHLDSTTAYNLQATNVLLGITTTMLSMLGNAPPEIALLAFSGRPVLAFLLNMGAPVIAVARTFKYQHPLEVLTYRGGKSSFPTFSGVKSVVIALGEYILAAAAAVNVALLAYDISSKAVYVPNCGRTWYAFLWMYLCLVLHPLALVTFRSQVRITRPPEHSAWANNEIKHSASHRGISYALKEETYLSISLDWVMSHGAIVQIIFGTLVLSATTLIDTRDAFKTVGLYSASAILCRLILMYELYGLWAAVAAGTIHLARERPEVE